MTTIAKFEKRLRMPMRFVPPTAVLILCACGQNASDPNAPPRNRLPMHDPEPRPVTATLSQRPDATDVADEAIRKMQLLSNKAPANGYDFLREGMSYEEAVSMLNSSGTELIMRDGETIYQWPVADGSMLIAGFKGGQLVSKSH